MSGDYLDDDLLSDRAKQLLQLATVADTAPPSASAETQGHQASCAYENAPNPSSTGHGTAKTLASDDEAEDELIDRLLVAFRAQEGATRAPSPDHPDGILSELRTGSIARAAQPKRPRTCGGPLPSLPLASHAGNRTAHLYGVNGCR